MSKHFVLSPYILPGQHLRPTAHTLLTGLFSITGSKR